MLTKLIFSLYFRLFLIIWSYFLIPGQSSTSAALPEQRQAQVVDFSKRAATNTCSPRPAVIHSGVNDPSPNAKLVVHSVSSQDSPCTQIDDGDFCMIPTDDEFGRGIKPTESYCITKYSEAEIFADYANPTVAEAPLHIALSRPPQPPPPRRIFFGIPLPPIL